MTKDAMQMGLPLTIIDTGPLTSIEICTGAGGQAIGLEQAGFSHIALVEIDRDARATLRLNRPTWPVLDDGTKSAGDIRAFSARQYEGVDLLAGGVPCPPFSIAGQQLGHMDERDLFPEALRLVSECLPRAVMLENVKGLLSAKFDGYRERLGEEFSRLGYAGEWRLLNASDFGVPQLRPRAVFVAFRSDVLTRSRHSFEWPVGTIQPPTVGEKLLPEMASLGWERAEDWAEKANDIAPTLVGGSRKHGGPDLGPTRARQAWARLGVDGRGIANTPPPPGFEGMPRLTLRMTAALQGFPADWRFSGGKTSAYRQIGNAFPPPVSYAVGSAIANFLLLANSQTDDNQPLPSLTAGGRAAR